MRMKGHDMLSTPIQRTLYSFLILFIFFFPSSFSSAFFLCLSSSFPIFKWFVHAKDSVISGLYRHIVKDTKADKLMNA